MNALFKLTTALTGFMVAFAVGSQTLAISEQGFQETYESKVVPLFKSAQQGQISSDIGGLKLTYVKLVHPNAKGTVLIVNGMTETILKYKELIYDLYQEGYSVLSYDHRGQGLSDRLPEVEDPQIVCVDHFKDYVLDLKKIIKTVLNPLAGDGRKFMIAHSMGGGIAGSFLTDAEAANQFTAVALSAPMLKMNSDLSGVPVLRHAPGFLENQIAFSLEELSGVIGKKYSFAPGYAALQPLLPIPNVETVIATSLTSSQARFAMKHQLFNENEKTRMSGPCNNWISQGIEETWKLQVRLWLESSSTRPPLVMFQAGKDILVLPEGQNKYCGNYKGCSLVRFADAQHEILGERDEIRNQALQAVFNLFDKAK